MVVVCGGCVVGGGVWWCVVVCGGVGVRGGVVVVVGPYSYLDNSSS